MENYQSLTIGYFLNINQKKNRVNKMTTKIIISIPDNLKQKLEEKIKETDFKSIEDYILYLLKQMVSNDVADSKEKVTYSDEDEVALKKKLKEMGYL